MKNSAYGCTSKLAVGPIVNDGQQQKLKDTCATLLVWRFHGFVLGKAYLSEVCYVGFFCNLQKTPC